MNRILKRQKRMIVLLLAAVIATNVYSYGKLQKEKNEIESLEKMNFQLQMNSDKLQEINDTYYSRIVDQQGKINELQESLERVLTINKKDIEKVQAVVMSEARGSTLSDAVAVTQTILNRSQLWDKSGLEIVEAPGQYAKAYDGDINELVETAFNLVYLEGYTAFNEPITHFYNKELCNPKWAEDKNVIGSIGNHVYMY